MLKEQRFLCCRPSAIPGPVPDELVVPATESIGLFSVTENVLFKNKSYIITWSLLANIVLGVKLLLKMGWRHGRSIKDSRTSSLQGMLLKGS